ncbi:MAG: efflux RND transporter periplasmic adaptor subunit [Candidatus Eremiobacteraeota bacterium]|nr:efflux RND transporter periplasmic adaptor subunit [Candidatus Eremiobacteraeota bacterium]
MRFRAIAALVAVVVVASACSKGPPKGRQGPPPLAVDVAKASQKDIATFVALDGQIAPVLEASLSSSQSGTIAAVYVNEGDRVSSGERLAQLDDATLRAQLAANQAAVAQSLARVQSSTYQAPISSQQYGGAYQQAVQSLQQARNRISTDQAALNNAALVYRSNQQLAAQGFVAQTVLEQSHSQYVAAQQELNNAREALGGAQTAVNTARSNTGQTRVDVANIEANKGALQQAQANVQLLQTQIAQTGIYAPFNGVVTQRLLDPGAFAAPNQPIVRVSQLDAVYVNVNVPDEDLGFVRAGTDATFTSASLPGKAFHGRISDVNATPTSGTLSYRARIRQPNAGGVLRGGMLVSVSIRKSFHRAAIVVPRTAIFETDKGSNVFTVQDGKAKQIPVVVGLQTDTLSEVRGGGVRPGTVVITTRPDALQDGSTVAVSGAPGSPGGPGGGPGSRKARGGAPPADASAVPTAAATATASK